MLAVSSARASVPRQALCCSAAAANMHPLRSAASSAGAPGGHLAQLPSRSSFLQPRLPSVHLPTTGARHPAPRQQVIQQSFFGVGAPEAVLVGVVALVVFGPKGLAEAAKSVGGLLRTFQPTIREVVEVSRDLTGTLEKELGLNEIRGEMRGYTQRPAAKQPSTFEQPQSSGASEEDPDIEGKRARSAQAAWGNSGSPSTSGSAGSVPSVLSSSDSAGSKPSPAPAASLTAKDLGSLSMEELEAELKRRRIAAEAGAVGRGDGQGTAESS